MKNDEIFIEVGYFQKNKAGNSVCGDTFMSQKLKSEDRIISVLSDGLGSGIKASVLSSITAVMAMNYTTMNESILCTAKSIIHTLPRDQVKNISYSTFCIFDIDCFGNTKVIEYETPAFYLFRKGVREEVVKTRIPLEREDLKDTALYVSEFRLEKEDRLICFTDGVTQSGMGSVQMPAGWNSGVEAYVRTLICQQPYISAKELARKVVVQAEKHDRYQLIDDSSCCVIYRRTPRNLLICSGPPFDDKNDRYLATRVKTFEGKKILCGGTTASIVSRELDIPIQAGKPAYDSDLPPLSEMSGIDLVTEGILTLSKVERMLAHAPEERSSNSDPAEQVFRVIQNSDKITFVVGTRINVAHQDPNLPVELEIRRNVVKKIKFLLETKYLKNVEIVYL